jgi:hypothetical protein
MPQEAVKGPHPLPSRVGERHTLNRRRSGTNDAYPVVVQYMEIAGGITACVLIVSATGMGGMVGEVLDARDPRQLGSVARSTGHDHKASPQDITAIGGKGQ